MIDMPRYRCHKEVSAMQIDRIEWRASTGAILVLREGARVEQAPVTRAWMEKHEPAPGGYFVQYDDGYTSFSPAGAFESGYTRRQEDPVVRFWFRHLELWEKGVVVCAIIAMLLLLAGVAAFAAWLARWG
jgi:hypothetical protein